MFLKIVKVGSLSITMIVPIMISQSCGSINLIKNSHEEKNIIFKYNQKISPKIFEKQIEDKDLYLISKNGRGNLIAPVGVEDISYTFNGNKIKNGNLKNNTVVKYRINNKYYTTQINNLIKSKEFVEFYTNELIAFVHSGKQTIHGIELKKTKINKNGDIANILIQVNSNFQSMNKYNFKTKTLFSVKYLKSKHFINKMHTKVESVKSYEGLSNNAYHARDTGKIWLNQQLDYKIKKNQIFHPETLKYGFSASFDGNISNLSRNISVDKLKNNQWININNEEKQLVSYTKWKGFLSFMNKTIIEGPVKIITALAMTAAWGIFSGNERIGRITQAAWDEFANLPERAKVDSQELDNGEQSLKSIITNLSKIGWAIYSGGKTFKALFSPKNWKKIVGVFKLFGIVGISASNKNNESNLDLLKDFNPDKIKINPIKLKAFRKQMLLALSSYLDSNINTGLVNYYVKYSKENQKIVDQYNKWETGRPNIHLNGEYSNSKPLYLRLKEQYYLEDISHVLWGHESAHARLKPDTQAYVIGTLETLYP